MYILMIIILFNQILVKIRFKEKYFVAIITIMSAWFSTHLQMLNYFWTYITCWIWMLKAQLIYTYVIPVRVGALCFIGGGAFLFVGGFCHGIIHGVTFLDILQLYTFVESFSCFFKFVFDRLNWTWSKMPHFVIFMHFVVRFLA